MGNRAAFAIDNVSVAVLPRAYLRSRIPDRREIDFHHGDIGVFFTARNSHLHAWIGIVAIVNCAIVRAAAASLLKFRRARKIDPAIHIGRRAARYDKTLLALTIQQLNTGNIRYIAQQTIEFDRLIHQFGGGSRRAIPRTILCTACGGSVFRGRCG